jgi:hypothetical protein
MKKNLLDYIPFLRRLRRNHALEHATMQVLSERYPGLRMAGISNPKGFLMVADLPTELMTEATLDAKRRLQAGETDLAIHPNCGSNIAVPAFVASMVAGSVLALTTVHEKKPKWYHYLIATATAIPAYFLARPLGLITQKHITTNGDIEDTQVTSVFTQRVLNGSVHKVDTEA